MAKNKVLSYLLLLPLSKVYGWVTSIRNTLFDRGILKSREFDIPVVVVGNITAGGAGKTPHTEYLVDTLSRDLKVGVLSRGYKRRTRGFVAASDSSTPDEIGDEPYQIYRKFVGRGVMVAVCEDRVKGIEKMRKIDPALQIIILDDAFQHRYVTPTAAVVLTEYNRPVYGDHLLPYGRLREPVTALNRADIVVVTKCPERMKPVEFRLFKENLNLYPFQKLLFSRYIYQPLVPLFPDKAVPAPVLDFLRNSDAVLAVTGVANPRPFVRYIRKFGLRVKSLRFPDHHHFSHADISHIASEFKALKGISRYIVTTEKDAVRLQNVKGFPEDLKPYMFYLPIKVEILSQSEDDLDEAVKYVIRNKKTLRS